MICEIPHKFPAEICFVLCLNEVACYNWCVTKYTKMLHQIMLSQSWEVRPYMRHRYLFSPRPISLNFSLFMMVGIFESSTVVNSEEERMVSLQLRSLP